MTTFLLIRHATHDAGAHTLAGYASGIRLSAEGEWQARRLARRLARQPVAALYSSPVARALQTAELLAERLRLDVQCDDRFAEIDFGEWSGRRFDELSADPRWHNWNSFRSGAPLPNGGLMVEVQARAVAGLACLHQRHPAQLVAVVSHADIIKAILAHYLGMSLELLQRLTICPASVSVVALQPWGAQAIQINAMDRPLVTA